MVTWQNKGGYLVLDRIIEEALHSHQYGALTNMELKGILEIVQFAKNDLDYNKGNRSKNAHDTEIHNVKVNFK